MVAKNNGAGDIQIKSGDRPSCSGDCPSRSRLEGLFNHAAPLAVNELEALVRETVELVEIQDTFVSNRYFVSKTEIRVEAATVETQRVRSVKNSS
jgi:hypothetical protein